MSNDFEELLPADLLGSLAPPILAEFSEGAAVRRLITQDRWRVSAIKQEADGQIHYELRPRFGKGGRLVRVHPSEIERDAH